MSYSNDEVWLDGVPRQDLAKIPVETGRALRRDQILKVVGTSLPITHGLHAFDQDVLRARSGGSFEHFAPGHRIRYAD